ncbi:MULTISPECIES: helix-turn-helix domain-containing protein [Listeria]|uniref:helix-turn-helix domain-containing protein n=1 Tax=Listeria TaxID=1637 RepID=UPI000B592138|nr:MULTISPECIES: helix-turn-helix transcriptional regulator [Listeria]
MKNKHWIERFMYDFDIRSRYELSKISGISQTTLSGLINRDTKIANTKYDTIKSLAEAVGIDMNTIDEYLEKYEME